MARQPAATDELLSLGAAAEELGVHYMTAYRYVRTGRLAASRRDGRWLVERAALDALAAPTDAAVRVDDGLGRAGAVGDERAIDRLVGSLVRSDEAAAWGEAQDLLTSRTDGEGLYLDVLAPVMTRVGDLWATGDLGIDEEHRASAVMQRIIARLGPAFARRGRARGSIVLGTPARERHSLPCQLLADPLRGRGFEVIDLGADVPPEALARAVRSADRLVGVGICATVASERSIRQSVRAVGDVTDVPVLVGGAATAGDTRFGAHERSTDAAAALSFFEAAAAGPQGRSDVG